MRHRVPVHLVRKNGRKTDPLAPAGGVAALVRAEAHWSPRSKEPAAEEARNP
jgi:hypothetical protein